MASQVRGRGLEYDLGVIVLMFESLTAGAERALKRAEAVARRREAELVEPLDLLAALTLETESRAAELMAEFGVEAARIWTALGLEALEIVASDEPFSFDSAPVAAKGGPIPQSPALRLVLSEAMSQVRGIDRNREAGTEHLLAGLISASDAAADLLRLGRPGIPALAGTTHRDRAGRHGSAPPRRGDTSAGADRGRRRR